MKLIKKVQQNERLKFFLDTTKTRITDSEMGTTSIVVSYYLLLSLFPLIIALGNLLPFLQISPNSILPYLQEIIPEQVYDFIGPAIQELLTQSSGGLLSVSAVATVWSASQSINALQIAMNKAYGVEHRRNFIIVRVVSVLVILLFLIAIVGVTLVVGVGKMILDSLQPIFGFPDEIITIFQTVKWPLVILTLFILLVLIYWSVPNAKVRIRWTLPGATFATVGWMALSQLFGLYAKYFAARISGYQIIGSFMVLMIWLNLAATIIILGGIINAVTQECMTRSGIQERENQVGKLSNKLKAKLTHRKKKHNGSDQT